MPFFPSASSVRWVPVVLRSLPILIVVLLSAPAWMTWPFLTERRQRIVLEMVRTLSDWTLTASSDSTTKRAKRQINQPPLKATA